MKANILTKKTIIISILFFIFIGFIAVKFFLNEREDKRLILFGEMKKFSFTYDSVKSEEIFWYDLDGDTIYLESLRGNIVLVNFWASWCLPCVKELPSINKISKKFSNEKFKFVVLNIDRKNQLKAIDLFNSLDLDNLDFFYDKNNYVANSLKISVIPTTIVYDKKGVEIGRIYGEINWNSNDARSFIEYFLN